MAYCVNCGVELDESATKCALCDTPVLHPFVKKEENEAIAPYSNKQYIPKTTSKRYVAFMITIVLLIPNVICAIANVIFPETGNWSLYLNSTSFLVFILFISPFLYKKVYPYLLIFLDAISILLYVYFFYSMYHERRWFFHVCVPLVIALDISVTIFYTWCNAQKRDWPYIVINLLTIFSIYSIFTEVLFDLYYQTGYYVKYSLIILVSSICLIAFFLFVAKNKRFRSWLSKRMFV